MIDAARAARMDHRTADYSAAGGAAALLIIRPPSWLAWQRSSSSEEEGGYFRRRSPFFLKKHLDSKGTAARTSSSAAPTAAALAQPPRPPSRGDIVSIFVVVVAAGASTWRHQLSAACPFHGCSVGRMKSAGVPLTITSIIVSINPRDASSCPSACTVEVPIRSPPAHFRKKSTVMMMTTRPTHGQIVGRHSRCSVRSRARVQHAPARASC